MDGRWLATAGLGVAILNAAAAGALAHTGILAAEGPLSVLSLMTFLLWTLLAGRALLGPNAPAASHGPGDTAAATAHAVAHR